MTRYFYYITYDYNGGNGYSNVDIDAPIETPGTLQSLLVSLHQQFARDGYPQPRGLRITNWKLLRVGAA